MESLCWLLFITGIKSRSSLKTGGFILVHRLRDVSPLGWESRAIYTRVAGKQREKAFTLPELLHLSVSPKTLKESFLTLPFHTAWPFSIPLGYLFKYYFKNKLCIHEHLDVSVWWGHGNFMPQHIRGGWRATLALSSQLRCRQSFFVVCHLLFANFLGLPPLSPSLILP